jgi:uncharacterized RDD family membrane protein YckC
MTEVPDSSAAAAPGLARRMASFLYEGVLLFAVAVVTALVFSPLVQQRHAMTHRYGLMLTVGLVFAAYFVFFWSKSGQTLPMKTWHLRVVDLQGRPLTRARALLRFLLCALWFLPALLSVYLLDLIHSSGAIFGSLLAGIVVYAGLSRLHPQRQFLHDVISGTQLITQRPVKRAKPRP